MELQLWKPLMVLSLLLLSSKAIRVCGDPQVPCIFVFGDSLSDSGNNNNRATFAKADFLPYGIDFQNSIPTGRFTNDMNAADFTAKLLGFPNFIPPFAKATATGQDILQGVNYASGGAGIRDETGLVSGRVATMKEQILNHKIIVSQIVGVLRSRSSAEALLNKCIYSVNIGSNDYLNNYLLPQLYLTSRLFTPQQFALALTQQLKSQLEALYREGARKFAVYGVGLLGCTPYARAHFKTNGNFCADRIDDLTNIFNDRLKSLVIQLNADLLDAKFTFINSRVLIPTGGQLIKDTPCCQIAANGVLCQPQSTPCPNREQYVFYDAVHPTNATFYAAALQAYQPTSPDVAYPYSISQLALL